MNLLMADNGFPRRNCVYLWVPAELAIQQAVDAVEVTGADPRLTDAVILLGKARDAVADYIDEQLRCPRCGTRIRQTIAFDTGDGRTQTRLAKWCDPCLGTP